MIGCSAVEGICLRRIGLAEFPYQFPFCRIGFIGIKLVQNGRGSAPFGEDIITETPLSPALERWSIGTETGFVILPGKVVHTLGINSSAGHRLGRILTGRYRLDLESLFLGSIELNREYEFAVTGELARKAFAGFVENSVFLSFGQFHLGGDQFTVNFCHFGKTVISCRVADLNRKTPAATAQKNSC